MSVLRSLFSAFLMYSRIPTPKPEWNEESRRYSLCFFPLIGAVIGILLIIWYQVSKYFGTGNILFSAVCTLIPIAVTGGIHIDGFCDVNDAIASCSDRERMLEIMKDSHTGAFAVIRLCVYLLFQTAVFSEARNFGIILICALAFVQSRAWSALAAVTFPNAKEAGSLYSFSKVSHKKITAAAEIIWLVLSSAAMILTDLVCGISAALTGTVMFLYYYFFSKERFGGITGDLAGWFLQMCELLSISAAAAVQIISPLLQLYSCQ